MVWAQMYVEHMQGARGGAVGEGGTKSCWRMVSLAPAMSPLAI